MLVLKVELPWKDLYVALSWFHKRYGSVADGERAGETAQSMIAASLRFKIFVSERISILVT